MTQKLDELSIFFPFWNEERNIEEVVTRAIPVAEKVAKKWEILMIDDGSSDKTLEIAKRIEAGNKHAHTISLHPNRGYGAALRAGFDHAKYRYVVFTDGDLQFDFSEVERFLEKIGEADIVIGFRQHRKDNLMRHVLMVLLKIWDFVFFRFYYRDIDCGFKMFRKEALEQIMPLRSEGAMITTEILAKAKAKKLQVVQVGVTHYSRKFGDQSGGNVSVIIRAMLETFILFWDIKNRRF
ncbi:MAG: glycosyltransferase family 2 protein [bacterium]|nr:glycosyltransferase family 2 protein [bacterium]